MDNLPVRRIHIDSREKDSQADSHSDFRIRLSQSCQFPEDTICMVDNITIANTFKTTNALADSLYIAEKLSATSVQIRKLTFDHAYYDVTTLASLALTAAVWRDAARLRGGRTPTLGALDGVPEYDHPRLLVPGRRRRGSR